MELSPESPTSDYTEAFDNLRDSVEEYIDIENLSEGDCVLFAKCFVCRAPALDLNNRLTVCGHKNCETYICDLCLKNRLIRRGVKCALCPTRFCPPRSAIILAMDFTFSNKSKLKNTFYT